MDDEDGLSGLLSVVFLVVLCLILLSVANCICKKKDPE